MRHQYNSAMNPQICGAIFCSCAIKPVSTLQLYNPAVLPWRTQLQTQAGQGGQLVKWCQAQWNKWSASALSFQNKSFVFATITMIVTRLAYIWKNVRSFFKEDTCTTMARVSKTDGIIIAFCSVLFFTASYLAFILKQNSSASCQSVANWRSC